MELDKKIEQCINKDTGNIIDKCFENLYSSLEKDIELMCKLFKEDRSAKETPEMSNNSNELTKVKKRIDVIIKTITELNILDQGGTSYLGGGSSMLKND